MDNPKYNLKFAPFQKALKSGVHLSNAHDNKKIK